MRYNSAVKALGIIDVLYFLQFLIIDFVRKEVPLFYELKSGFDLWQTEDQLFYLIFAIINCTFAISCLLSGVLFILKRKFAVHAYCIQIPFRFLLFIPSLFFCKSILLNLLQTGNLILAVLSLLTLEAVKLAILIKWRENFIPYRNSNKNHKRSYIQKFKSFRFTIFFKQIIGVTLISAILGILSFSFLSLIVPKYYRVISASIADCSTIQNITFLNSKNLRGFELLLSRVYRLKYLRFGLDEVDDRGQLSLTTLQVAFNTDNGNCKDSVEDFIKKLLLTGFNINEYGFDLNGNKITAIHDAIVLKDEGYTAFLIGKGADLNIKVIRPGTGIDGLTSIQLASHLYKKTNNNIYKIIYEKMR